MREISLSFRGEADAARIERIAAAASRFDFAALSVWDDLGDPAPWPLLRAFAQTPGSARIGPACLAVPKYAALDGIVSEIAALESMRPGRVFLGLAAGSWMEQVGLKSASVTQMREAVSVARYLFEKRTDGFDGRYYHVEPGFRVAFDTPRERVPLLVGAWGERMAAMAGEVADEVKLGGSSNAALVSLLRERVAVGATRAGRDVADVGIVMGAVTVVDDDGAAAREAARRRAAVYIPVVGPRDPTAMRDFPDAIARVSELVRVGDIDAAARALPDGLLARFAFAGTPEDVIAQAEALFDAGATRVDFGSPHGLDEVRGVELLGERVLPSFLTSPRWVHGSRSNSALE